MSRARITALALVNWKGVFYERYLLDRHVTALEGANGAGKTTVMIAAYVVLLPDMSRLRFTNLGESGATGGDRGIWGRLGESGRPAYAVLEVDLGAQRLLLGVCLLRGSEPTVEPRAFIISNLEDTVPLSELLLIRNLTGDQVPELRQLRETVSAAGATIQVFRATKDYFAALFDYGITPLRLTSEDDRTKWNDLLRTSMTGGISRALGTELRSFLLREESGLSDTLSRMRKNLQACRRTRLEVAESRHLEREISAIYEAGLSMFTAALHAARVESHGARARTREAATALQRAQQAHSALAEAANQLAQREQDLALRCEEQRGEVAALKDKVQQTLASRQLSERLAALDQELGAALRQVEAARAVQQARCSEREALRAARDHAMEAYDRASLGLADLQQGLTELARRAHAYGQLQSNLAQAREWLGKPELSLDQVATAFEALCQGQAQRESERARLAREARDLELRRDEAGRAQQALAALEDGAVLTALGLVAAPASHPHDRARTLLSRCAQLEADRERCEDLEQELGEAERLLLRQQAARALAQSLELPVDAAEAPARVVDELSALEREIQAGEKATEADSQALAAQHRLEGLHEQLAALEPLSARFHLAQAAERRLREVGRGGELATRAALLALRDQLLTEQLTLRARHETLAAQRESLQLQAAELARGSSLHDAELLRVRDALSAELLARRFDDLQPAQAGWVQARLGPWVDALVVDDLDAATHALARLEHDLPSVHLVRADESLELDPPAAITGAMVVTPEAFGARVTRLPSPAGLGRSAREARLRELHAALSAHTAALEACTAEMQRNGRERKDADLLWSQADVWLDGDPEKRRADLLATIARVEREAGEQQRTQQAAREHLGSLRARTQQLRRLLPDARLLAPPAYAPRVQALQRTLAAVKAASAALSQVADARATLAQLLDTLRSPPPDDHALAVQTARRTELDAELEHMFQARSALQAVIGLRHAEAFADAQAALGTKEALSPALAQQQQGARAQLQATEADLNAALSAYEKATEILQAAQATTAAMRAQRERTTVELQALGGPVGALASEQTAAQLKTAEAELLRLFASLQQSVADRALAEERLRRAGAEQQEAALRLRTEERDAQPAEAAWQALRDAAHDADLLHGALALAPDQATGVQLRAEATSKRELLLERVARARGGEELAASLKVASDYLSAFQAARTWLARRVPAQIAAVKDPLLSLQQLRDHLDALEARLRRQEGDLRGRSEDVARGIDVQLRRAQSQVRRLNQHLHGVQFGSIHGIRIDMRRLQRMEQILSALQQGQAQELLFNSSLPIEEALDEVFRRYGGGAKSGGQRLLDYREYIELTVEIHRQAGADWEPANATRLSTGEAIGVGAALMMVVLTEWERDANLLGPRNKRGSVRFLFLDEANRLSRDNLGVLFDLCRNLDLQLLVAAPEVARAEGNTTYRLVRHTTEDGREEVIVSGRRAMKITAQGGSDPPDVDDRGEPTPTDEPPAVGDPHVGPPIP